MADVLDTATWNGKRGIEHIIAHAGAAPVDAVGAQPPETSLVVTGCRSGSRRLAYDANSMP